MSEFTLGGSIEVIAQSILGVITANPEIWIPIMAAWALGFVYTRYLNGTNCTVRRDREFKVYTVNGVGAFILYCLFNMSIGMAVLPQATLASAVAVLVPAAWFWYQNRKKK